MNLPTHWKTKEGTLIPLKEMTDTHLANTKAMLERNIEKWSRGYDASFSFQGEMASYYAEQEADGFLTKIGMARLFITAITLEIKSRMTPAEKAAYSARLLLEDVDPQALATLTGIPEGVVIAALENILNPHHPTLK